MNDFTQLVARSRTHDMNLRFCRRRSRARLRPAEPCHRRAVQTDMSARDALVADPIASPVAARLNLQRNCLGANRGGVSRHVLRAVQMLGGRL